VEMRMGVMPYSRGPTIASNSSSSTPQNEETLNYA